jgi:transcriptional regulator with XRE-family HTH domain
MKALTHEEILEIRQLRNRHGMTYLALAQKFGVSKATIYQALKKFERRPGEGVPGWRQVHQSGDTRSPWNKGKKARAVRSIEEQQTLDRYRERRRRDVAEAIPMISPRFLSECEDYLHGRGDYSHG